VSEASSPASTRDTRLDVIRGVAIALVVYGHVIIYANGASIAGMAETMRLSVYSFHMPLLMLVSGFVIAGRVRRPYPRWIGDKALRLMVPFSVWYAIPYLAGRKPHPPGIGGWLAGLVPYVVSGLRAPGGGLWYLDALFLCLVVVALVRAALPRWEPAALVATFALLAGAHLAFPAFDWGLPALVRFGPYFVVGYLVGIVRPGALTDARVLAPLALAFPLALGAILAMPDAGTATVLAPVAAMGGSALAILVSTWLARTAAASTLALLGRESFGIYVCHMFGLGVWAVTLGLPLGTGPFEIAAETVLVVILSLASTWALRTTGPTRVLLLGERWDGGRLGFDVGRTILGRARRAA
jgi:fucose 4-O-acetylase-like acetyltransferase